MKQIAPVLAALFVFAGCATPAAAWDEVGVRQVSDRAERDTITLPGGRTFNRIKICVYRNPVHFHDLDVRFRNGGNQDVSLRSRINAGQCTRAIDLNGGERDIQQIIMRYEEASVRRRRATVRVFAE